jgi:hypothetical protein
MSCLYQHERAQRGVMQLRTHSTLKNKPALPHGLLSKVWRGCVQLSP